MATKSKGHRIVFVTGKGGVGKSLVAAATADQFARSGHEVLLVEFGSRSFYGALLNLPVDEAETGAAVPWREGIRIARWDAESSLREYLTHYLLFKAATDRILGNTAMKALVAVAPSLSELALLGRLTAPMRHRWYAREADVVVVDGYSTGQFMALLRAPRGLAATSGRGPIHDQSKGIRDLLCDPSICDYRLVTLAEEMPVAEACEMAADLRAETGIAPTVYCNRMLELPARLPKVADDSLAAPFVHHLAELQRRQKRSLTRLSALGADIAGPVRTLPLIPSTDPLVLIERLGEAMDSS